MKTLTKAEEEVMQAIWQTQEGTLGDIYENLPPEKPAYNTIASIVRILEKKGFVSHKTYGRVFVYFPKVDKKTYSKAFLKNFIGKYFDKSVKKMLSAFGEDDLSLKELQELEKYVNHLIQKKKNNE